MATNLLWMASSLALMSAGFAVLLRRQRRLRRSLDEAELRLAARLFGMRGRIGALEATIRELEFEGRRARGAIRFDPDMPVAEALAVHPRVREVLAVYGVVDKGPRARTGSAGSMASGGWEHLRLAEACVGAGVDPAEVLDGLRSFVDDPATMGPAARRADHPSPTPPSRN